MRSLAAALYSIAVTAWVGSLISAAIGFIAAPLLFARIADRTVAGALAGVMFTYTAWIGLGCGAYLVLYPAVAVKGWRAFQSGVFWIGADAGPRRGRHFGVQPILAQLKSDALPRQVMESALRSRFATWHGVSSVLYLVQSLLGSPWWCCRSGARAASAFGCELRCVRQPASWSPVPRLRRPPAPTFAAWHPLDSRAKAPAGCRCAEPRRNRAPCRFRANRASRIFPLDAVESQLDQFVGLEATVDLGQHGRRQALSG
jgi:hypothetical protein